MAPDEAAAISLGGKYPASRALHPCGRPGVSIRAHTVARRGVEARRARRRARSGAWGRGSRCPVPFIARREPGRAAGTFGCGGVQRCQTTMYCRLGPGSMPRSSGWMSTAGIGAGRRVAGGPGRPTALPCGGGGLSLPHAWRATRGWTWCEADSAGPSRAPSMAVPGPRSRGVPPLESFRDSHSLNHGLPRLYRPRATGPRSVRSRDIPGFSLEPGDGLRSRFFPSDAVAMVILPCGDRPLIEVGSGDPAPVLNTPRSSECGGDGAPGGPAWDEAGTGS